MRLRLLDVTELNSMDMVRRDASKFMRNGKQALFLLLVGSHESGMLIFSPMCCRVGV